MTTGPLELTTQRTSAGRPHAQPLTPSAHRACLTPKRSLFESEGPISEDYGERVSVCAMRSGRRGLLFCGDCAPVDTVRQSATVRLFLHGQATASPLPAPLEKWELELTGRGR